MVLPIVIVNYNNPADTIECIQSLLYLKRNDSIIVLVDNSDDIKSVSAIKNWLDNPVKVATLSQASEDQVDPLDKPVYAYFEENELEQVKISDHINGIVIIKAVNRGFAAANNLAISTIIKEDFPWIWLLNSDTVVPANTLQLVVPKLQSLDANTGLVANTLCYYHRPDTLQGTYGIYSPKFATASHHLADANKADVQMPDKILGDNEYPIGASLFVKTAFVKDVGLMSEAYFIYFEEIDWVIRGQKKGWNAAYLAGVPVYHKEGASIKSSKTVKSLLADMYSVRNRLLFTRLYFKEHLPMVNAGILLTVANRIKRRQFKRAGVILKYLLTKKFDGPFKLND